jgi:hypothetical protein
MIAATVEAGTPPGVTFDPASRAFVFRKRWLAPYPILGVFLGLFSLTGFEQELRGLLSGRWSDHPLMAGYLAALAYLFAVVAVNRTTLRIGPDRLEVDRGPIPVPFARSFVLARDQVVAFTLFEERSWQSHRATYELLADTVGGGQGIVTFGPRARERGARLCAFLQRTLRPSGVRPDVSRSEPGSVLDAYSPLYAIPFLGAGLLDGLVMELGVTWRFDRSFGWGLAAVFVALAAATLLVLRRKYRARTLERLQPGEENPGPIFYLALAAAMTVMLVPVIMFASNLL